MRNQARDQLNRNFKKEKEKKKKDYGLNKSLKSSI